MECDLHSPLARSSWFMKQFDLTMTYRRDADVWVGYVPGDLLDPPARPPAPKSSDRLICSFISGRHDRSGRTRYLEELARHVDLHTYGKRGNRTLAVDRGRETKLETIATYAFTIAFENAVGPDYVTEKFFDPLLVGSVPVYLGTVDVADFAPTDHCYIDASDFPDPEALAKHLLALAEDPAAYAELVSWRDRPLRPAFRMLFESRSRPAFARLCDRILELRGA